jgi:L-lactate dehydrogenase complex protein LldG
LSSARDDILGNIRRSLGVTGQEAARREAVAERIGRAPKGVIPSRAQLPAAEQVDLFVREAQAALATVARVKAADEVPQAVAEYLRNHNLPAAIRRGEDPRLDAMPWGRTALDVSRGVSEGGDLNAVSHAFGGIAESGTLVLLSGPENPSTLNFLPDNHIVVVAAADVVGDYETIWGRVREAHGRGAMPRTVNFITGPSRSGDIEQTLLLGAHGPRRLHIVVVENGGNDL